MGTQILFNLKVVCSFVAGVLISWPLSGQEISTAEMLDWLSDRREFVAGSELSVHHEQYWGSGSRNPPEDPGADSMVYIADWTASFVSGDRYRYEKRVVDAYGSPALVGATLVFTWDGGVSRQLNWRPNAPESSQSSLIIANKPTPAHYEEDWLWWLGLRVPWSPEAFGFDDLVQAASERQVITAPSGPLTVWKGVFPGAIPNTFELVAERVNGHIRLRAIRAGYVHGRGDVFSTVEVSYEYDAAADEKLDLGNHFFLARAGRVEKSVFKDSREDQWVVALIDFKGAREIADDSLSLCLDPVMNTAVWDERYRIGYRLGSRTINVDGRLFLANDPVDGEIGASLEEWLANGKFVDPVEPPAASKVTPARRVLAVTAGLMALGLVMFEIRRYLRNKRA